jgi:hypothetical protein
LTAAPVVLACGIATAAPKAYVGGRSRRDRGEQVA